MTSFTVLAHTFESNNEIRPQQNGNFDVPISTIAHIYAKRSVISFEVCGGGTLLRATRDAAEYWNSALMGRVQFRITQSQCANTAYLRNGRNELYFSQPGSKIQNAVGLYQGILDRQHEIIAEEDITVDDDISDLVFLTNIITHELGHALGLDHARWATCRESVMAEYACRQFPTPPTSIDIGAAKRIYRYVERSLDEFDRNSNGQIDDGEFFAALDHWLRDEISDILLFDLVDAWIKNRQLQKAEPESSFSLLRADHIELYDLSGRLVGRTTGLSFGALIERLPRETYLYRAFFTGDRLRVGKITKS